MTKTPQEMKEKIDDFRKNVFAQSEKRPVASNPVTIIITILSDLLGGLLVGAGLGYLCVTYLGAHKIFFAIFILLGGFAGLLNLYKSMKRLEGGQK